ncbi:MAG: ribosome maturation factor RimP [Gemmatimonadota bacterium]|nr:ribosome maturation factor RimP [Gemmatimonadota bacterium]
MDDPALQESIEKLVAPYLKYQGADLVDLQLSGSLRNRMLRIDVDRPDGITVDECARLSRGIADVLDTHDPISGRYVLEVSSPGLDRPLKSDRDYTRAVGQTVKVILEGGRVLIGQLTRFDGSELVLAVEGESRVVSADEIRKANLHFEF